MRRIALDWDFKKEKDFKKFMLRIKRADFRKLEIEPTKKGYHVVAWFYNYRVSSQSERLFLREYFGDDKKHIAMDKLHKFGRQTLFNKKKKLR